MSRVNSIVFQNSDKPKTVVVYRVVNGQKHGILFECCLNAAGHSPKCAACNFCTVTTDRGRCKRRACLDSEMCTHHLRSTYAVVIKRSRVPNGGLGLFARPEPQRIVDPESKGSRRRTPVFAPGDPIVPYGGIRMSPEEFDALYDFRVHRKKYESAGPYALTAENGDIVDALCIRRAGAYANDFHGSDQHGPNAVLEEDQLVALIPIYAGDEILLDYGEDYWDVAKHLRVEQRPVRPDPGVRAAGKRGKVVKH